jgi:hypothetical protein
MGTFFGSVVATIATGNTMGQCGECLRGCPIAIRSRTLKPKWKPGDTDK